MKIRSKVGFGLFAFSLLLVAFMMAMYIFFAVTHIWWPALVLTICVFSLCFVYFNTFYELLPDGIMLTCGFSAKAINYANIISMTDEKNSKISFCLATERVEIKYIENGETKFTYASPPNREQFRELVNKEIERYTQKLKESEAEAVVREPRQDRAKLNNPRAKEEKVSPAKEEKLDTMLVKSKKKSPTSSKKKEQEEKKLLTQLRKEKQKETKLAAKQEKEIIEKQQKVLMAQSKKNEKLYQENLKKQSKAKKLQNQANKLDKEQKRFAEKEGKKAEKIQEKKQAKARTQEIKVQAKEHKERVAAKKEVQQLKDKAEKAAARKEKQDKKSNK